MPVKTALFLVYTLFFTCEFCFAQSVYLNKNIDQRGSEIASNLIVKDSILFLTVSHGVILNLENRNTLYKLNEDGNLQDSIVFQYDSIIFNIRGIHVNAISGDVRLGGSMLKNRDEEYCAFFLKYSYTTNDSEFIKYCDEYPKLLRDFRYINPEYYIGAGIIYINGYNQFYLVKYDQDGTILFEKNYGTPGYQEAWSVAQLPDSGYVIAGWVRQGSSFDYDLMLVRTDKDGNQKWLKKYGGPNHDGDGNHVQVLKNGNILMSTCRHALSSTHYDSWLAIINPANGNIILEKYYVQEWNNCFFAKPIEMEDGAIVIGGYRGVVNEDSARVIRYGSLTKIHPNGNVVWDRLLYFNPQNNNRILGITSDPKGGFWGYGWTYNTNQDGWLIKVDSLGCPFPDCDSISVSTWEISTEAGISLRAYPNPASENAIIHYQFSKQVASPMLEILICMVK
ncbi:MAG: hypothetical protein IPI60_12320 [Saprospiraceae bacterium]|nr:hypothetical protein [Saprospiraceae bacterium]